MNHTATFKCAIVITGLVILLYAAYVGMQLHTTPSTRQRSIDTTFNFVKTNISRRGGACNRMLFVGTDAANFTLSSEYRSMKPIFNQVAGRSGFRQGIDGHSGDVETQTRALHLASQPWVHTVCETGFNAGHSAFNYLTANRRLVVHSFDIGIHPYTSIIAANMSQWMFPGRLFLHTGDSRSSIPNFLTKNTRVRCSLIFVDGGHRYDVALADCINFGSIADVENGAAVMFDDYWPFNHGPAWDFMVKHGYIDEVGHCNMKKRSYAFGSFIRRPNRTLISLSTTTIGSVVTPVP